jgi:hypothetical protein
LITIRKSLFILFFIFTHFSWSYGDSRSTTSYGGVLRYFIKKNEQTALLEYSQTINNKLPLKRSLGLSYRLKFHPNWSGGIFYKRAYGNQFAADAQLVNGQLVWQDTSSRGENIFGLEATRKTIPRWFTWCTSIIEWRGGLRFNGHNNYQTFQIRPTWSFVIEKESKKFMLLGIRYKTDIPLNYGKEFFANHWVYLNSLFLQNKKFQWGPFIAYGKKNRHFSSIFQNQFTQSFPYNETETKFGLALIGRH